MASAKGSPGPHDRDPAKPRATCIAITRKGVKCKRFVSQGGTKLCRFHKALAEGIMKAGGNQTPENLAKFHANRTPFQDKNGGGPDPGQMVRNGVDTQLKKTHKSVTAFVINAQAQKALGQLGLEASEGFDPKQALLWAVESSWRQARVWEAMLASVPVEDYDQLGVVPIPGLKYTAKGARIELIQRHLGEATKNAARTSKLAIDAGIEERVVRLAEAQSALIADTVRAGVIAAIGSMHLSPAAEKLALEAALTSAAIHLRQLAAGGPDVVEGIATRIGDH